MGCGSRGVCQLNHMRACTTMACRSLNLDLGDGSKQLNKINDIVNMYQGLQFILGYYKVMATQSAARQVGPKGEAALLAVTDTAALNQGRALPRPFSHSPNPLYLLPLDQLTRTTTPATCCCQRTPGPWPCSCGAAWRHGAKWTWGQSTE